MEYIIDLLNRPYGMGAGVLLIASVVIFFLALTDWRWLIGYIVAILLGVGISARLFDSDSTFWGEFFFTLFIAAPPFLISGLLFFFPPAYQIWTGKIISSARDWKNKKMWAAIMLVCAVLTGLLVIAGMREVLGYA